MDEVPEAVARMCLTMLPLSWMAMGVGPKRDIYLPLLVIGPAQKK